MATTMFFEEVLTDKEDKSKTFELEFGRSSYYRDNLIYLRIDGKGLIMNEATGRRIVEAMEELGFYLGYKK